MEFINSTGIFDNIPEALEIGLILRAIGFIFAFYGLGLMFSAGLKSDFMQKEPRWKRWMMRVAAYVSYGLAILNLIMTFIWIIHFLTS